MIPSLSDLYKDFDTRPNLMGAYINIAVLLAISCINLFFGTKLWSSSVENKEKYFKYGIVFAFTTFFLRGIFLAFTMSSIISPIYNLTAPLK